MIKRLVSLAFVAMAFFSIAPTASAQAFGTCTYVPTVNGRPSFWNCPPSVPQPHMQMMPIQGVPAMFASGGNQYRCPALAGWGGGAVGLAIGAAVGNHSTLNGKKLTLPFAIAGAVAGSQIACEYVRPNAVAYVPPQGQYGNSGYSNHGGVQPSTRGVFCNIDGVVTKEADTPTCEAKARMKAEGLVTGKASQVMSQGQAPICGTGKTWGRLNWEGHPQHNTFACLPGDAPRFQE